MKKNRMMRLGAILLVCVLMTTAVISGTFAKYATDAEVYDAARVAYWGLNETAVINFNLFASNTEEEGLQTIEGTKLLAPGTKGSANFAFVNASAANNRAPEVDYKVIIDLTGTTDSIGDLDNEIVWSVDGNEVGNWGNLKAALLALSGHESGEKKYEAGVLADSLKNGVAHSISWEWAFAEDEASNIADTALGNADELQDIEIKISITVEQVN